MTAERYNATLTCFENDDLLAAYALGALTPAEARDVRAHMATCTRHRKRGDEFHQIVSLLALSVDERQPSPGLRDRVIQSVRSAAVEGLDRAEVVPALVPIRRAPRLPRWAPQPALLAMAATVLLAVGIGIFAGPRMGRANNPGASQPIAYQFKGGLLAPTARASLVYLPVRRQAVLAVNGLPPLSPGQVYEMWLMDSAGLPTDEGIATAKDGRITAEMHADLSRYRRFAITIEPGERQSPTTTPVLQVTLRGA